MERGENMSNKKQQLKEEKKIQEVVKTLGVFSSMIKEILKAQEKLINETNRKFELIKLEVIKKRIKES